MDSRKQIYTLFVLSAFMLSLVPEIGFSLGFGQTRLESYLNEPLHAEIELQGVENIDIRHLIVSLAPVEDFKRIELARPYFLSTLRFEVIQKNKQTILKVTSEEGVKQPYLEFLVLFTWPDGRMVRDYTLLLDPAPFGGISKQTANEQALQMLNKTDLGEGIKLSEQPESFQDPKALLALLEKAMKQASTIPPTEIAAAKSTVGINDVQASIIADKQIPNEQILNPATNSIANAIVPSGDTINSATIATKAASPTINPIQPTPAIESKSTFSRNQIFLGSGLGLLFAVALTAWFLRGPRSGARLSSLNSLNIVEDIVIFDEEMKLKIDLAKQYIAFQDIKSAEAILDEIISRGNSEEIKLAKGILKKINRV